MNEQGGNEHEWEISCCSTSLRGSRSENGDLLGQSELVGFSKPCLILQRTFFSNNQSLEWTSMSIVSLLCTVLSSCVAWKCFIESA
jgi:hypothetical protein